MRWVNEPKIDKKKLRIDPTAEKVQILRKKISKIQLLFNFQKFDTKIFAKLLATKKKYLKMFEGLNDLKIEKKSG